MGSKIHRARAGRDASATSVGAGRRISAPSAAALRITSGKGRPNRAMATKAAAAISPEEAELFIRVIKQYAKTFQEEVQR